MWPALRRVASGCALLWDRSPWSRASLRLREPYHYETPCMIEDISRLRVCIEKQADTCHDRKCCVVLPLTFSHTRP
jgi:hypothetical protein